MQPEWQKKIISCGTRPPKKKVLNASHMALLQTKYKEVSSKSKQLTVCRLNAQITFFFQVGKGLIIH